MSNMKRLWEEEQERMMREAGMTEETLSKIEQWMNNRTTKEQDD